MKKITICVLALLVLSALIVSADPANPGSIKTTSSDCSYTENHYNAGEQVYINGSNFNFGTYSWSITGKPGQASCTPNEIVASGTFVVNSTNFCFNAYTIANNNCGEYSIDFNGKNHNYDVNSIPAVPEFGMIAGLATLIGAVGIFFFVRKK